MSPTFNVSDLCKYYQPETGDEQLERKVGPLDIVHYNNLTRPWLEMVKPWFWTSNGPAHSHCGFPFLNNESININRPRTDGIVTYLYVVL